MELENIICMSKFSNSFESIYIYIYIYIYVYKYIYRKISLTQINS